MNKYPRLLLLFASFVLAYALFAEGVIHEAVAFLNMGGYSSAFLGGLLFSFGFTTPFAIGIFVEIAETVHPLLAAAIGGCGALISDYVIFRIVRFSFFHDELHRLRTTRILRWLQRTLHHSGIPDTVRTYILWSFAGLIIASPLPDEIGVSLVSGATSINSRSFALICFAFNALGIFLVLSATLAFD